jgi:uncharacterized protein (DUF1697 family)
MKVVIGLLRGVNLAGRHQIKMDVLRALCESLGLCNPQTWLQSGNVIFTTKERDLPKLARRMESAIEKKVGFRPDVVLRTSDELREVITKNPFTKRNDIEGSKLLVTFFEDAPAPEVREQVLRIKGHPEEIHMASRELYIYYPDGMGRSKLNPVLTRALKNKGTARNWNTVGKLLEMSEKMEL